MKQLTLPKGFSISEVECVLRLTSEDSKEFARLCPYDRDVKLVAEIIRQDYIQNEAFSFSVNRDRTEIKAYINAAKLVTRGESERCLAALKEGFYTWLNHWRGQHNIWQ